MKKRTKVIIIVFLICGALGGLMELFGISSDDIKKDDAKVSSKVSAEKTGSKKEAKDDKQKKAKKEKKSESKTKKELPADKAMDKALVGVIGEDRINTYTYFEGFVTVIATAKENLTIGLTLSAIQSDTLDILEQAAKIKDVDTVSFSWKLPATDSYGNDTEVVVMKATFERDTIDRINFDNINLDNLPDIADSYNVHQSFK